MRVTARVLDAGKRVYKIHGGKDDERRRRAWKARKRKGNWVNIFNTMQHIGRTTQVKVWATCESLQTRNRVLGYWVNIFNPMPNIGRTNQVKVRARCEQGVSHWPRCGEGRKGYWVYIFNPIHNIGGTIQVKSRHTSQRRRRRCQGRNPALPALSVRGRTHGRR